MSRTTGETVGRRQRCKAQIKNQNRGVQPVTTKCLLIATSGVAFLVLDPFIASK